MKHLALTIALTILASCGKHVSDSKKLQTDESATQEASEQKYTLPDIGFHRSVMLNPRLEHTYENFTFDPSKKLPVLGDRPFLLFLSENNQIDLEFYSRIDLKAVYVLDLGDDFERTNIKALNLETLKSSNLTKISNYFRQFTYGIPNPDSPVQDMLNKVFVLETEASDGPYRSNMKFMVWADCIGNFKFTDKKTYSCENGKLRISYKLLDYKLEKDKI